MIRNALEPWHLLIVLAIVTFMFGATKLPELARGLGQSIRIFRAEVAPGRPAETGNVALDAAPSPEVDG